MLRSFFVVVLDKLDQNLRRASVARGERVGLRQLLQSLVPAALDVRLKPMAQSE